MNYRSLKQQLRDVSFTTPTPFNESGEDVQHQELSSNLEALEEAGASTFIPCGNTGEYYSLTQDERVEVVATHVEATSSDATIVAGAGGSLKTTRQLLSQYERVGADAAMIMHPRHTYIHEKGLANYYRQLAEQTELGLVIYKRDQNIPRDVIMELSELDNVVAVKYAVNNIKDFSQTVADTSGDLVWLNGIAERYALSFAIEGAEGFTTGIGNATPEAVLALQEAIEAEDWERARELRDLLRPYEDLREEPGPDNQLSAANNVPAVKHGMEFTGLYGGPVRDPLIELSEDDRNRTEQYIQRIQEATV